jgi:hypothetical protein
MATKAETLPAEGWGPPAPVDNHGITDIKSIGSAPKPEPRIPENFVGMVIRGGMPRLVDNRSEEVCRRVLAEATAEFARLSAEKKRVLDRARLAELEERQFKREEDQGLWRAKSRPELLEWTERLQRLSEIKQMPTTEYDEKLAHLSNVTMQRAENRLLIIKAETAEAELLKRLRVEIGPL